MSGPSFGLDRIREIAGSLVGAWGPRARASTTPGRERAILRLFGVGDLDRGRQPLAGSVVRRYVSDSDDRLASGVALPFAMGLVEYDVAPQQLALDVAAGAIDLGLEARLLGEPERRAAAEREAARLGRSAMDRIDANRIARREVASLLGDAPAPWIGGSLGQPTVGGARLEARALVRAGADLVRVAIPTGQELADRLLEAGMDAGPWWPSSRRAGESRELTDDAAPSGSQRGIAVLRGVLDELAAERRAYTMLGMLAPALGAPEGAVVAAFERVDVVWADPMGEIVGLGLDPDRALADHAFANRLHRRSGALVVFDAGPLAVAPDLALGVPATAATRAGRALALQFVAVCLAVDDGLPAASIAIGALPGWVVEERDPVARAIASVAVRRWLFPAHRLAFDEGPADGRASIDWPFVVAAGLAAPTTPDAAGHAPSGPPALAHRPVPVARFGPAGAAVRAALAAATESAASLEPRRLSGPALEHADAMIREAIATLERLRDDGWQSILGEPVGGERGRLAARSVAEATESFDPLGG